jgi:hypothetical protein
VRELIHPVAPACFTTKLKTIRQRNMEGLSHVFLNRCHMRPLAVYGTLRRWFPGQWFKGHEAQEAVT